MGFNSIVAQQKAVRLLKGTLKTGKIPNAFLFIGDPFIGKTTTAVAYAKALNCLNPEEFDSCEICKSCKKIEQGLHPDVKIVKPEKDIINVSTIRDIEEFVSFHPLEANYKVVIIREAHKMNQAAANAFLKTIEEPPLSTTIILTCENIYALPEPLVSRCFKIHFTPLPLEAVKKIVPEVTQPNVLRLIMGRPGLLISKNILKDLQWFVESLKNSELKNKKSIWKDNEEVKWWIDFMCILIRDALNRMLSEKPSAILPFDFKIKERTELEQLFSLYEELQALRKNVDLNLNKSIVWNYIDKLIRRVINV